MNNEELINFRVDQNTNPIELYKFIIRYVPFNRVLELYKLLNYKIVNLEDDPKTHELVCCSESLD